jgi:hypothetical protein
MPQVYVLAAQRQIAIPARDAVAESIFASTHVAKKQAGIAPHSAPELCTQKALIDQGLFSCARFKNFVTRKKARATFFCIGQHLLDQWSH